VRMVSRIVLLLAPAMLISFSGIMLSKAAGDARIISDPLKGSTPAILPSSKETTDLEHQLLARAKENTAAMASDLVNFICRERIERFRAPHGESIGKPIDVITSNVSFEDGQERYTEVFQNNKARRSIASVSGAWSEGEYATFLNETRKVLDSGALKLQSVSSLNGVPAGLFSFEFNESNSPWDLQIASRHYPVGFLFEMWVGLDSGEILRVSRSSTSISPQSLIAEVDWLVNFDRFDLDGKTFMLPKDGLYSVTYLTSAKHEWNVLAFSDYHRFGSEVAVHFQ